MKNVSLFESSRSFVIYSYDASWRVLLLRSRKTKETPTRLDILFQDVKAMEIRTWFEGLTIEEVDATFLEGFRSNPAQMMEHGHRVYALRGVGWHGFILGGIVSFKEDDGDYYAPSGLMG